MVNMKYLHSALLFTGLACFSGTAHGGSTQYTEVAIRNKTNQPIVYAMFVHKYPEGKFIDSADLKTTLAKNDTYLFTTKARSIVGFGEMGADWWQINFVKADGTICYSNPDNYREWFDEADKFWAAQGDNIINVSFAAAATAASVGTGGAAAAGAVVAAGVAAEATKELLSGVGNTEATVGFKMHTIDNGDGRVTLEVWQSKLKLIDSNGGDDVSETVLECFTPEQPSPSANSGKTLPSAGTFFQFESKKTANKCVSVWGGSTANGANIAQWSCDNTNNIQFSYRAKSNGWFEVYNNKSKKCIVVENASTANNANIIQYDCNGTDNSLWKVEWVNNTHFQLKNKKSNKCLVIENASSANGANIIQYDCVGTDNSLWKAR